MTLPPVAPELAARLANYLIDDRARAVLRELGAGARSASRHGRRRGDRRRGPAEPGGRDLPEARPEFRRIEIAQFRELLKADFGPQYLELLPQHHRAGDHARLRRPRAHEFRRRRAADCDRRPAAQASLLARKARRTRSTCCRRRSSSISPPPRRSILQRVRDAASARRQVIDEAIGEFDGAIGGVIDAIKEATGSLTATSATVQQVDRRHAAPDGVGLRRPRRRPARASISPWPRPKSCRARSRRSASRPRAASTWRARRSPTPSAPTRPSARSTRRPSASARWSG